MGSNLFDDKNQSSIVSSFDEARQTSELEALGLAVAGLRDPEIRRLCQDRLGYAEDQAALLERNIERTETAFVNKRLKLLPQHQLVPPGTRRTYAEIVEGLKQDFRKTPEYLEMRQHADWRKQALFENVTSELVRALAVAPDNTLSPSKSAECTQHPASPVQKTFKRAVGR